MEGDGCSQTHDDSMMMSGDDDGNSKQMIW